MTRSSPAGKVPLLPGRVVTLPHCQDRVRRALEGPGHVIITGRASAASGKQAVDLAASSALNSARDLALHEGVEVRHMLPTLAELKAHHRTTAVSDPPALALDGTAIHQTWSLFGSIELGVLVLLVTGSGTKISSASLEQPAIYRLARLVYETRPAVVYSRSLERAGRASMAPLIEVMQAQQSPSLPGPFLGDEEQRLSELDFGGELNITVKGLHGKHAARRLRSNNYAGMRTRTGAPHTQSAPPGQGLPGVWEWGTGRLAPPGFVTLSLRDQGSGRPRTYLVLDTPAAWPQRDLIVAGPKPVLDAAGKQVCQVSNIRWLGEHLYTDGWGSRECAAYLAEHGWRVPGRARLHGDDGTLTLRTGYTGRNDGRAALQAFLRNLELYRTGRLTVRIPDGGDPIVIDGVLDLEGHPLLTDSQIDRITAAQARRHCGPVRKHLFAGLPVMLGDVPASLVPKRTTSGVVYYFSRRAEERDPVAGARAHGVPPIPHEVLAGWYAHALRDLALPLSLQLARHDPPPDSVAAKILALRADVEAMRAAQRLREREIDPGTRTEPLTSRAAAFLREKYDTTAVALADAQQELTDLELRAGMSRRGPSLRGASLHGLVGLAAALQEPYDDTGHRLLLQRLSESVQVSVARRLSVGRLPAYELTARLSLLLHDEQQTWRATSTQSYLGGVVHRAPRRLADALNGLYEGRPLPETCGRGYRQWLPAIRESLGVPDHFALGVAQDPRLLRLAMAVAYPRRPVVALSEDPERVLRVTDGPVPVEELGRLARRLREPVALLRAVYAAWAGPTGPPVRWLHDRSPRGGVLYARVAEGQAVRWRDLPPGWVVQGHRLAGEWQRGPGGSALLAPCSCGSSRRTVSRLREVTGSLCLDCGHDRARVRWSDSYQTYRDLPGRDD